MLGNPGTTPYLTRVPACHDHHQLNVAPGVVSAIAAYKFDRGGEGVAYHDTTAGNQGNGFARRDTDVDVADNFITPDSWTPWNIVRSVATGEWLNYTVRVVFDTVADGAAASFELIEFVPAFPPDRRPAGIHARSVSLATAQGESGFYNVAAPVQEDAAGRLLVARRASLSGDVRLVLTRYAPTGEINASFGAGGVVTCPWDATAVLPLADGRTLIARSESPRPNRFAIVFTRLRFDGSIDPTFGPGGEIRHGYAGRGAPTTMFLDAAGRILVAGAAADPGGATPRLAVWRYTPDGAKDHTFAGDTHFRGPANAVALHIRQQADGALIVVGVRDDHELPIDHGVGDVIGRSVVVRLTPAGRLDRAYHPPTFPADSGLAAPILQDDDRLILTLPARNDVAMIRLTPAGDIDPSFGRGGRAPVSPDPSASFSTTTPALTAGAAHDGTLTLVWADVLRTPLDDSLSADLTSLRILQFDPDGALLRTARTIGRGPLPADATPRADGSVTFVQ